MSKDTHEPEESIFTSAESIYETLRSSKATKERIDIPKSAILELKQALLDEHSTRVRFVDTHSALPEGSVVPWAPVYCNGESEVVSITWTRNFKKRVPAQYREAISWVPKYSNHVKKVFHHFILNGESADGRNNYLPYTHLRHQCDCLPGPHMDVINSKANIIASGGGRGSGKSEDIIALLLSCDNNGVPLINDPKFRALVIRHQFKDLRSLQGRIYGIIRRIDPGAKLNKQDGIIELSSGAEIHFNHMSTPDSVYSYHGKEYWVIAIDELEMLPTYEHFTYLLLANRTQFESRVRCRMLATFNPGGPGASWIIEQFVEPTVYVGGKPKKIRLTLPEYRGAIITRSIGEGDSERVLSHQFVHSTVADNPYLYHEYRKILESIPDEHLRARMLHGDFFCFEGTVFKNFRTMPFSGEPSNARHVYPLSQLGIQPWDMVAGSLDWGHEHYTASIKYANNKDRMIIYDEISGRGMDARSWGQRVAHWWKPELSMGHRVIIWLSHDAFHDQEYSQARLLQEGANDVLGHGKALALDEIITINKSEDFIKQFSIQAGKASLVFINSGAKSRVFGWDMLRFMLSWKHAKTLDTLKEFDENIAKSLFNENSIREYYMYMQMHSERNRKVLPRFLVADHCEKTINAIQSAVFDTGGRNSEDVKKTNSLNDDFLDALRYGVTGFEYTGMVLKPIEFHMTDFIKNIEKQYEGMSGSGIWRMIEQERKRYERLLAGGESEDSTELEDLRKLGAFVGEDSSPSLWTGWQE